MTLRSGRSALALAEGAVQEECGADQCQVGEGLREVAKLCPFPTSTSVRLRIVIAASDPPQCPVIELVSRQVGRVHGCAVRLLDPLAYGARPRRTTNMIICPKWRELAPGVFGQSRRTNRAETFRRSRPCSIRWRAVDPVPDAGEGPLVVSPMHSNDAAGLTGGSGPSTTQAPSSFRSAPVAIVGIGCRFPGGITDPRSFWDLIVSGVDAVGDIPPDRWRADDFFDADPATPSRMFVRQGGFLRSPVDEFDAGFFGMSPREAAALDPQQRLLLEVTWEAFEDAVSRRARPRLPASAPTSAGSPSTPRPCS